MSKGRRERANNHCHEATFQGHSKKRCEVDSEVELHVQKQESNIILMKTSLKSRTWLLIVWARALGISRCDTKGLPNQLSNQKEIWKPSPRTHVEFDEIMGIILKQRQITDFLCVDKGIKSTRKNGHQRTRFKHIPTTFQKKRAILNWQIFQA